MAFLRRNRKNVAQCERNELDASGVAGS